MARALRVVKINDLYKQARLYSEFERQDGDHVRSFWRTSISA